jgi:hypothetical protein
LQEGLYKVEFHTVHGTGTGVIYAINGKLRGGNSAFAFIGSYADKPDGIQARVTTQRHNADPAFKPLFGTDMITLTLKGRTMAAWWTSKAQHCNCPASTSGRS